MKNRVKHNEKPIDDWGVKGIVEDTALAIAACAVLGGIIAIIIGGIVSLIVLNLIV